MAKKLIEMISEAEQKSDLHQLRVKFSEGLHESLSLTEKLKIKYKAELKRRTNCWKNKIYDDIKSNKIIESQHLGEYIPEKYKVARYAKSVLLINDFSFLYRLDLYMFFFYKKLS